ncbi:RluA family pseudouridine synthase [Nostoc sp. UHCC 0870]|uniref:RluA family pseudouridine synthase n=1 Tax=Nostoc sp. UHCC 0870 TaxID=2914041 RepID=UPI001EE0B3C6|nr:RluA family pseudouridine synthase [Nostoc sp. UHCC 0870]UKO96808.1 pseudouridine synthase [Nostoc sp. UHCC 0870]
MILHQIADFLDYDWTDVNQSPSYWYEGRCLQTGDLIRLPRTPLVEAIACGLMQQLAKDECYSHEGKMYGVLLVELPTGEQRILKAFSGLLNGESVVNGWVAPIPGREQVALQEAKTLAELEAIKQELITLKQLPARQEYETLSREFAQQLQAMSDRHSNSKQQRQQKRQQLGDTSTGEVLSLALEELDEESRQQGIERRRLKHQRDVTLATLKQAIAIADTRIQSLKQQRKALSRQLQAQMHAAYSLMNFLGQSLSLQQLMPDGLPTGTGDCCAPKLLHYAATHGLKPLAMAEFWYGTSNQDKVQGEFYGACAERCQPLMGFLLAGLRPNPPTPFPTREGGVLSPYKGRGYGVYTSQIFFLDQGFTPLNPPLERGETGKSSSLPFPRGGLGWGNSRTESDSITCVYEDEHLIAINKPAGLLSVPGRYLETQDSVSSRLRNLLPDGDNLAAVHRLDQETSGILLVARDSQTYRQLSQQFQQRQVHKVYEAILAGVVTTDTGLIELPLWGDPQNRPYQQVNWEHGKPSVTRFRVMAREREYTRVEFAPLTGRTHQLRVHALVGLGVVILGDRLYGCNAEATRLHLHARELRFQHPHRHATIHLQTETPF